jgi:hypothetical protein
VGEFFLGNWYWIALIAFFFFMRRSGMGCCGSGRQDGSGGGRGCAGGEHGGHPRDGRPGDGGEPKEEENKMLPAGARTRTEPAGCLLCLFRELPGFHWSSLTLGFAEPNR